MFRAAFSARSHSKPQRLHRQVRSESRSDCFTAPQPLHVRRRIPAINAPELRAVPFALVLQLPHELGHAGVAERPCQPSVTLHPVHVQGFHRHGAAAFGDLRGGLVVMVRTDPDNLCVLPCQLVVEAPPVRAGPAVHLDGAADGLSRTAPAFVDAVALGRSAIWTGAPPFPCPGYPPTGQICLRSRPSAYGMSAAAPPECAGDRDFAVNPHSKTCRLA